MPPTTAPTAAPTSEPTAEATPGPSAETTSGPTEQPTPAPVNPESDATSEDVTTPDAETAGSRSIQSLRASREGGGGEAVVGAIAAADSPGGDWGATPLSESATWSAGGSGGSATWSYPLRVPAVPSGLTPSLAIDYNSGSVDGRTASKNNQASWIGEGFDLAPGFVDRRYVPCSDDTDDDQDLTGTQGEDANNATHKTGDLCWRTDNAVLTFAGSTDELVPDGDDLWRKRFDDGSRIRLLHDGDDDPRPDADNGAYDGEHWELTTPDGTRYYFGLGEIEGQDTESAWTVPVFGNHPGEPGYDSDFPDSVIKDTEDGQTRNAAWRWNLDYVVDLHGNALAYTWNRETNKYGLNNDAAATTYTRGGVLSRIDYGFRDGQQPSTNASAQVVFTAAERCNTDAHSSCEDADITDPEKTSWWPDLPGDLICTAGTCGDMHITPTFFTRKRLAAVTTQVGHASSWDKVDAWALDHSFVAYPGEAGTSTLWPDSITHTGKATAGATPARSEVELPKVELDHVSLENRVDGVDLAQALHRPRLSAVYSGTGAILSFTYATAGTKCTKESVTGKDRDGNTSACFPVRYAYPGAPNPTWNWFHKYVVDKVTQQDNLTGSAPVITTYDYLGSPAWAYDDSVLTARKDRTWNQWRGYGSVSTTTGDGSAPIAGHTAPKMKTLSTYYRGLYGTKKNTGDDPDDPGYDAEDADNIRTDMVTSREVSGSGAGNADTEVKDYPRFVGQTRQVITYNGSEEVSLTVTEPWQGPATAQAPPAQGKATARLAGTAAAHTFTKLSTGQWRHGSVTNQHDLYGYVTESVADADIDNAGDPGDDTPLCTTTGFVRDTGETGTWILDRVATVETVSGACSSSTIVSSVRNYYDGHTLSATPTRGLLTKTETIKNTGSGTEFGKVAETTYDMYGRALTVTDALGQVTTTSYRHNGDGLLDQTTVTAPDPDGAGGVTVKTVTTSDPLLGAPLEVVEPSGKTTRAQYDALGRLTGVWRDGRSVSGTADVAYTYLLRPSGGPNAVTTKTRVKDEDNGERTLTSIELLDGLLRPRQTQSELAKDETYPSGGRLLTQTRYDSRGLVVQTQGPAFNSNPASTTLFTIIDGAPAPGRTETVYDGAGRPTKSKFVAYDEVTTDPEDGEEIPSTGELLTLVTTTTYDGDRVTVDAPTGAVDTTTVTDGRGRTIKLEQHGAATQTTKYEYTPAGQLEKMTDPAGAAWTYSYDLRGNQISATDPDHGTTTADFDDAGRQVSTTDAEGRTLVTKYDPLGRPVNVRADSENGPLRSEWTYDTGTGWTKPGLPSTSTRHLSSSTDSGVFVTKVTGYDAGDRPTGSATVIPEIPGAIEDGLDGTYSTTATYNDDGSLKATTTGNFGPIKGEKLTYGYDTNARPEYLTGSGSYVSDVIRAPYGEALRYGYGNTWANAAWERLRYQPGTRRVTDTWVDREIPVPVIPDTEPGADDHTTYAYDLAGNPKKITTDRDVTAVLPGDDETQCFDYDALRQLTAAWTPADGTCTTGQAATAALGGPAPYSAVWAFNDENGNRTGQNTRTGGTAPATTSSTYTYVPGTHQVAAVTTTATGAGVAGTDTYHYDDTGNTDERHLTASTNPTDQTLDWNVEGKLDKVTDATGEIEKNYYDTDGTRIVRRDKTATTLYLGDTELTLNRTTTAKTWNRHYTFDGRTIATRDGNAMTDLQILITDPHDTATYAIEAGTSALLTRRTLPYGGTRGTTTTGWASTRGFVNGTLDPGTGLTNIGARQYDPNLGKFLSVDPLLDTTDPQQVNGYSYSSNNPLTYSDPTGLRAICPDGLTVCGNVDGRPALPSRNPDPAGSGPVTNQPAGGGGGSPSSAASHSAGRGSTSTGQGSFLTNPYYYDHPIDYGISRQMGPTIPCVTDPSISSCLMTAASNWAVISGAGSLGALASGFGRAVGETAYSGLNAGQALGRWRVNRVVQRYAASVVETERKVVTPYGKTDIDVVLKDAFIEIGGPAKGNLSKFGSQLQRVKWAADEAGKRPVFMYDAGTPQEAINLAAKWFGEHGVRPIG